MEAGRDVDDSPSNRANTLAMRGWREYSVWLLSFGYLQEQMRIEMRHSWLDFGFKFIAMIPTQCVRKFTDFHIVCQLFLSGELKQHIAAATTTTTNCKKQPKCREKKNSTGEQHDWFISNQFCSSFIFVYNGHGHEQMVDARVHNNSSTCAIFNNRKITNLQNIAITVQGDNLQFLNAQMNNEHCVMVVIDVLYVSKHTPTTTEIVTSYLLSWGHTKRSSRHTYTHTDPHHSTYMELIFFNPNI